MGREAAITCERACARARSVPQGRRGDEAVRLALGRRTARLGMRH